MKSAAAVVLALSLQAPLRAVAQLVTAESDYLAGVAASEQGDTSAALPLLEQALNGAPPGHPLHVKTLYALGVTAWAHLKTRADADLARRGANWLERFLAEAVSSSEYAPVIPHARQLLDDLRAKSRPAPVGPQHATSPVSAPVEVGATASGEPSWPWHWITLGGALAAGGAGVYLGLHTLSEAEAAGTTLDSDASSEHLDRARTSALACTVAFSVAGAAAVASGVLWWLHDQDAQTQVVPSFSGENAGFVLHGRF